ncbi:MAG: NAD(+)/NADH kinase [Bacteroidales bacterium]|nr:NAD(+)/NADH kinase [Bacteroidales bacterium]
MKIALFGGRLSGVHRERTIRLMRLLVSREDVSLCYYRELYSYILPLLEEGLPDGEVFDGREDFPANVDALLSLGGDGTVLSAASLVAERAIPIVGINFGHLGFLTTEFDDDARVVEALFESRCGFQERSVLTFDCPSVSPSFMPMALNELSFHRQDPVMLGLELRVNGIELPPYWADGLLISTPTGSTAYSLSAGGPIVTPDSHVLIISPVAPHNLNVRPLIVPDTVAIKVSVRCEGHSWWLAADNHSVSVDHDATILVRKADFSVRTMTSGRDSFFRALRDKLLWGEDKRFKVAE